MVSEGRELEQVGRYTIAITDDGYAVVEGETNHGVFDEQEDAIKHAARLELGCLYRLFVEVANEQDGDEAHRSWLAKADRIDEAIEALES